MVAFSDLLVVVEVVDIYMFGGKVIDPCSDVGAWVIYIRCVGATIGIHVVYVVLVINVGVEEDEPLEGLGVRGEGFVSHVGYSVHDDT
jgi:hypothetical protein